MTAAGPKLAVPPGRAGRLWLVRRIAVASRAADVLDRKLRILTAELDRLRGEAERTSQEWDSRCRQAEQWLLRAVLLGGERAVELAPATAEAELTISYAVTMGVRHPAGARCVTGRPAGWEGPAVAQARQAHQAALTAAAQHAAARAALAAVERETSITRYRLRAVRDRWIPRLRDALAQADFSLEELERADAARLRRAAPPGQAARGSRPGPSEPPRP
ncbi:MAG TPA: V-type ATP synthase subunit D [Streptosporangiaceae bacterium]|nr:V-type ATP synthase subunit D [Streptosporangiaceae bacterium]